LSKHFKGTLTWLFTKNNLFVVKIQDVDVIKNSVLPFNIKLRVVCGYGGLDEYL
jgi:hypothetical protein